MLHFAIGASSLGKVLVATSEKGVCAVLLGSEDKSLVADLKGLNPRVVLMQGGEMVERALTVVLTAIETGQVDSDLVIASRGTDFQRRVWDALMEIPVGSTTTYKEIAAKVGMGTAQEIGEACAANTVAVLIPCHRVVRSDGSLADYRWGIHRKRALLQKEQETAPAADSLFFAATRHQNRV